MDPNDEENIEESDDEEEGDESDRQFMRNLSDDGMLFFCVLFCKFQAKKFFLRFKISKKRYPL